MDCICDAASGVKRWLSLQPICKARSTRLNVPNHCRCTHIHKVLTKHSSDCSWITFFPMLGGGE